MRKKKTWIGVLLGIWSAMMYILKLPSEVADVAASWSEFSLQIPVEVVRMLVFSGLWVVASLLVAPAIAGILESNRRKRRRARFEDRKRRERERDIRDFLTATIDRERTAEILLDLAAGPTDFSIQFVRRLKEAGVIRPVSKIQDDQGRAVFRLDEIARPIVEEMLTATPSADPQSPRPGS